MISPPPKPNEATPIGDLDELPADGKRRLDITRMIACRTETRMMATVAVIQGVKERPEHTLGALFRGVADIVPMGPRKPCRCATSAPPAFPPPKGCQRNSA